MTQPLPSAPAEAVASAAWALRTLGALDLGRGPGGTAVCRTVLAQPKRLALLVHLAAARPGEYLRRDRLLGLFWPELDGTNARAALRQSVRFLRSALGADVIEGRGTDELRLQPGAVWHDVAAFERGVAEGACEDALELYRGDFLAGFFVAGAGAELEQWIEDERARLRRLAVDAAARVAARHERRGRLDEAVRAARRAVSIDPLHEPAHRELMSLLDAAGDQAGALDAYDALARRLERDYGGASSPETRALRDAIQRRATNAARRADARADARDARGPAAPPVPAVAPAPARTAASERPTAPASVPSATRSLVILPFAASGDLASLADGVSQSLHAALQPALRGSTHLALAPLAGEAVAERVRTDADARRRFVGDALVVDGEVARLGDAIVVVTHLVDAADGRELWRERFERPPSELFALQESVARAIATALRIRLAADAAPLVRRPTHDLEAYNLYLRGRWHWARRPREVRKGLECFERAVARDPLFALAHAGIADCYNVLGSWEASELPSWEAFPRAHAAARKALEIDPTRAEAHTALAYAELHYTWRRAEAARELHAAVSLDPTYGHAHHWHSHLLMAGGRVAESLDASRNALACDPLDPVLNVHMAWHHWLAREPDATLDRCRRTLELHPGDHWSPFFGGMAELLRGDPGAAVASQRQALDRSGGSPVMAAALAHALAVAGEESEARGTLAALEARAAEQRVLAYEIAIVHTALGSPDRAFEWLDRACDERSAWLAYAAVEPRLDPLRGDERFTSLLRIVRAGA